jgi:hypothetical protein
MMSAAEKQLASSLDLSRSKITALSYTT